MDLLTGLVTISLMVPAVFAGVAGVQPGRASPAPHVTRRVLLTASRGDVDHIVIRGGTWEAIGYGLGKLAREKYGVKLLSFTSPAVGKEKEAYIRAVYPCLAEKIRGIKRAYGIDPADTSVDASILPLTAMAPACSALFLPPSMTASGHALSGRNTDWVAAPGTDGKKKFPENSLEAIMTNLLGQAYVLELYPDNGYATLVLGSTELANVFTDGINEMGLVVQLLQDDEDLNTADPEAPLGGGKSTAISFSHAMRMVLEQCATVAEAKEKLRAVTMTVFGLAAMHALIFDTSGNAVVVEIDTKRNRVVFTDYKNTPVPLTNYAVHLHPDVTAMVPKYPDEPYDDTVRRRKLHDFAAGHAGKFTADDVWKAMALVEANMDTAPDPHFTGEIFRPVWTVVTDACDRSMVVKYFLRDGPGYDPARKAHETVYAEPFTFRLRR